LLTPYIRAEANNDASNDAGGFGDTQMRLKINLWGNDGLTPSGLGNTAFAIMPFVKLPTGADELSNDHLKGGVIFPLAAELPAGFGLGLMAEIDFVYNETGDDYGLEFVHSAVLGHDITGKLAGYVEYLGVAPHDTDTGYRAIGSAGLTYMLSDDWLLDFGVTASPSDDADDFSIFAGTTFRL
ncbi:MAG: transporter, partial [Thiotrichales bacterium]|nr:transporter [Thiotrichales bacterium]